MEQEECRNCKLLEEKLAKLKKEMDELAVAAQAAVDELKWYQRNA